MIKHEFYDKKGVQMYNNLVSIDTFKQQVWDIEGVKVRVKNNGNVDRLVRAYEFSRLPDDATVDDLQERINWCLEPFQYVITL